jgi:DNA mismatch repair protein MutL
MSRDLFQLAGRYIVSPIKSGLMLVDQEAALERIWFEHFMDALEKEDALVQQSMFPKTIEFPPADQPLISEIMPLLNKLGFDIQEFGHGTYIIHGVPASFDGLGLDEEVVIQDTIAAFREDREQKDALKRIASALARGSRTKGPRRLQKEEMQSLVDQLFACESPYATPGGKRCFITIDMGELERKFQ